MTRRILSLALAAACLFVTISGRAIAQTDSGSIRITVSDQDNHAPLELARVVLDGPVVTSELTRKNGQVSFVDVPDGIYRARIAKSGYQAITSAPFEVVNGRAVTVTVALASATNLKVIGTVVARSTAAISTSSITEDSAQRKLSNDLAGALSKLSGVSVSTTSDDSDAQQTISLEGHDASQTQLTLDGIPLNAPGSAGNLGAFATDLFGGASVRQGPQIGGLGGSVGFSTLQPTLSWMSQLQASTGSNGRYNYSFGETGSLGKLGLALQETYRLNPSLVDGMQYLDASGLTYVHDGDSSIAGSLARARYQFSSSQTLTGTFLGSNRSSQLVCLRITQSIPCGYGPGNSTTGNVQLYSLQDNALIGETDIVASIYSSTFSTVNDQLDRYVNGVAQPIGFAATNQNHGFTVNATLPERERHTISVQAYGTWSDALTTPLVTQARPYYNSQQNADYAALQITDSVHANDRLTLSESFGASRSTGGYGSALGSVGAAWRPTSSDAYTASFSVGGVASGPTRSTVLTDPASLRFDCNGNVIYGNAPGDQPTGTSSTSERIGYTRTLHGGSVTLALYNQVQTGTVLPVEVNGSVLTAAGVITPAYLAAVQQIYQSPAGCSASAPLSATQLYFTTPVGGVRRVYQGGSLSGFVRAGNLVVQPFWNVNVSKAISTDPRIDNPYSIAVSGQQLPNVPLQRGGIVFDYKAPHSNLEWLADAQYTAKNNPNNLPAYTQFDAGVSAQLTHGTLTLAASNITNAYSGIFASPDHAVPYEAQNGTSIATIARPLAPRNYSVTYSVKFGPGAGTGGTNGLQAGVARSEGGAPGGDGGGPGRRFGFSPLPSTPPTDPFAISEATCTGDALAVARADASALRGYVAKIEAAKTATGYPASMEPLALENATVTYHAQGTAYALAIVPKQGNAQAVQLASAAVAAATPAPGAGGGRGLFGGNPGIRALVTCFSLHVASADDVTTRHLYTATGPFRGFQLNFMPAVGLYVQARQPQAGQESFRVYALPSKAPADPFELRTAESCTPEFRSSAQAALSELRANLTKPGSAAASLWTITSHAATSGTWYDLAPSDPSLIVALLSCGRVANATPQEIVAKGWDGALVPHLNYAAPFGLYLIRPQPSGQQPRSSGP